MSLYKSIHDYVWSDWSIWLKFTSRTNNFNSHFWTLHIYPFALISTALPSTLFLRNWGSSSVKYPLLDFSWWYGPKEYLLRSWECDSLRVGSTDRGYLSWNQSRALQSTCWKCYHEVYRLYNCRKWMAGQLLTSLWYNLWFDSNKSRLYTLNLLIFWKTRQETFYAHMPYH